MLFEPFRRFLRTMRFRLTAWNTAMLLLVVLATLVGVREGVRRTLMSELDDRMRSDLREIKIAFDQIHQNNEKLIGYLQQRALGRLKNQWFVQLFDTDAYDAKTEPLWASPNAPRMMAIRFPVEFERDGVLRTQRGYRMIQFSLGDSSSTRFIVRVGTSQEYIDTAVDRMTEVMLLAAAGILVVGPLGGYWLAGRATKPLSRIISTTARLQPSNLAERLPNRRTGDEMDRLANTINGMLDRIASYLNRNRDFIANAAHELRSPLTAMRTSLEVALDAGRSPEERSALLAEVLEECTALGNLVTRLLVLAEGDAGRLGPQPRRDTNLDKVVHKSVDMFRGVAETQGVELEASRIDPVKVPGEETYLRQVVQNLVDNAIKFTPPGGTVHVDLHTDRKRGFAELSVADTGVGIPAEDLPHIFERFYRGDKSRQRGEGIRGYGLGLSICHSIITALHGHIVAKSTPGKGSTFTVNLPLNGERPNGER